jgi:hypothetical protein
MAISPLNRLFGNSSPFIFFRSILFISFGYWLPWIQGKTSKEIHHVAPNDVAILISNERVINVFFFFESVIQKREKFLFSSLINSRARIYGVTSFVVGDGS